MKKGLFILLLMTTFLSLALVSSTAVSHNIVTSNNSEFNTGLPTIQVNVTGNCSNYLANLTIGGVDVLTGSSVTNNTNTDLTATSSTSAGNYVYNVTFYNSTCDSGVSNTTTNNNLEINAQPVIDSVSESTNNVLLVGNTLTWTNLITDANSTGNDTVTVYVCKTNAFTTSCTGGQWTSSSGETDGSIQASYTILSSDTGGTKDYYIFALDDNNYTSSSSSGNFVISRPVEGETDGSETDVPAQGKSNNLWLVLVVIVLVIVIILFMPKK